MIATIATRMTPSLPRLYTVIAAVVRMHDLAHLLLCRIGRTQPSDPSLPAFSDALLHAG
jgi:hypothetical protein